MLKVTRGEYHILRHHSFDIDWPLLVVRYQVEGESRRLVLEKPIDPRGVDDQALINALLAICDDEAQWSAEHPEQIDSYKWVPCVD